MRVFFSFLLGLNVTVFAKRFVESLYDREGVEVVNGREVEIIGDDVTEETGEIGRQRIRIRVLQYSFELRKFSGGPLYFETQGPHYRPSWSRWWARLGGASKDLKDVKKAVVNNSGSFSIELWWDRLKEPHSTRPKYSNTSAWGSLGLTWQKSVFYFPSFKFLRFHHNFIGFLECTVRYCIFLPFHSPLFQSHIFCPTPSTTRCAGDGCWRVGWAGPSPWGCMDEEVARNWHSPKTTWKTFFPKDETNQLI